MVAENGKLKDIDKIEELFASLMDAKSGMVQAVVTSAQELAKKDVTTITKALEKRLEKGKKLSVTTKVAAAPPASLSLSLSVRHCRSAGVHIGHRSVLGLSLSPMRCCFSATGGCFHHRWPRDRVG